jgi:hypothetical protein
MPSWIFLMFSRTNRYFNWGIVCAFGAIILGELSSHTDPRNIELHWLLGVSAIALIVLMTLLWAIAAFKGKI